MSSHHEQNNNFSSIYKTGIVSSDVDVLMDSLIHQHPINLSKLSRDDQRRVIEWNSTHYPCDPGLTVQKLVEIQAEQGPELLAIQTEDRTLTYQELNQRANQLALHLRSLMDSAGLAPNPLIGICMERSPELIIALLAILKAGAAYLPLDISYPADRLHFMLENAQAQILITQSHLRSKLPDVQATVLCFDSGPASTVQAAELNVSLSQYPGSNFAPCTTPDSLGYVIYTSGSTGKPKGVAMPQRALVNLLIWQLAQSALTQPEARTLQFTPVSFDVSFQEIFATLAAGGTLVLISDRDRRNPSILLRYLSSQRIERLFLPFVALRQLAEIALQDGIQLPSLREVITAGEQLRITNEIRAWFAQMPNCTLHNHYGPSESHVVTAFTLSGPPQDWPVLPPIGRPIANTQIYLLDADQYAVPPGTTGELYIAGDCLAQGYIHRPDITAERFIRYSYCPQDQASQTEITLYKTGDLARYLDDGNIEYLGRIDQQVKIRGFRIEPGEIEAVLEQHPEVKETVVLTREATPGNARLVAYIIPLSGIDSQDAFVSPFTRRLREFSSAKLPDYMVPSAFVVLESFPLTPSGKVDRRALPIPEWTRTEEGDYIVPRSPIEEKIAAIWQQLLGIQKISIYDSFFSLGGHSLLAVQMMYQVKEQMQVDLDLNQFLETGTIAALATLVHQAQLQNQRRGSDVEPADETVAAEGRLDESIWPPSHPSKRAPAFFLTGATGFLGNYLLWTLLRQTRADVYCLVRATSPAEGYARLQNGLSRYGLWNPQDAERIIPVMGSLTLARLGIPDRTFQRLSEKLDAIYHCGAWVNVIYPYSVLESANVLGTQEILRLASQHHVKPVHYISTVDVFHSGDRLQLRTVHESDSPGPARSLYSGYAKSKYIAETLLHTAESRGIPVSIYRPSNIMGDTRLGLCPKSSFVTQMLLGCSALGIAPEIDAALNLVPADYVSQAIVHLSQTEAISGQAFNIVNPQSYSWIALIEWMQRQGYPVALTSYEAWCSAMIHKASETQDNALFFLTTFLTNLPFIQKSLGGFHFQCDALQATLNQAKIYCSPVDEKLLELYFSSLIKQELIATPNPEKVSA